MSVKVSDAVALVVSSLGQVPGSSVQVYSEPRITQAIQKTFSFLIKKYWWPEYMIWNQHTLDGTLGIVTDESLSGVMDFYDVHKVYDGNYTKTIPTMPPSINPFKITGDRPLYYGSLHPTDTNFVTRKLQFWPKNATVEDLSLVTLSRQYTVPGASDVIYMDQDLIVEGATWMILNDEDINPEATSKYEQMFTQRYKDIIQAYSELPIETPLVRNNRWPHDWVEEPY